MFIKKLQKKNISLIRILLYIVLIISFFSVGYHLFTYGISNIHSDNAVELTAIESIFTNKDIFPSSWIYGNGDINLMRIQVFLVLPFIFLENWAIAREIGASQSLVSHQLKVLKDADLVRTRKEKTKVYYALKDRHIRLLLGVAYEHVMEEEEEND